MKKLIFTGLCIVMALAGYSQNHPKFSSDLQRAMQEKEQVDVLILFHQQVDAGNASLKETKIEKGAFIHRESLEMGKESQQYLKSYLEGRQIKYRSYYLINSIATRLNHEDLYVVAEFPEVERVIHDGKFKLMEPVEVNSGGPASRDGVEWGIQNIKADQVWSEFNIRGDGVVIGGQDTGYEWDHPALKEAYRGWDGVSGVADHNYNWHDAINEVHELNSGNNPCGIDIDAPCDDHSHGTHTMGTMVGLDGNNIIGVAPEAKWIGARNMERGNGRLSWYIECFQWFIAPYPYGQEYSEGEVAYAPHVINNSWACVEEEGCNESNLEVMREVVEKVKSAGIVVVTSNGNLGSGCNTVSNPAIFDEAFSVGAINSSDGLAGFSSRGPVLIDGSGRVKPDVAAPGVTVRSSILGGAYGNKSGTSMAGPHVAGAIALLISADPNLAGKVDVLEETLTETVRPKWVNSPCGGLNPGVVPNNEFGYGIINVYAAVSSVLEALPLRLLSFSGRVEADFNKLDWRTTEERNFSHFEVQRSVDGLNWNTIRTVEGQSKSQLQSVNEYGYRDYSVNLGKSYYRLRQVDKDGDIRYSETILLYRMEDKVEYILYPNPSQGRIYIKSSSPQQVMTVHKIQVYNQLAQMVAEKKIEGNSVDFHLSPGLYFYKLIDANRLPVKSGKIIVE